jgi:dTDP-4-amino-4,6-dideoxy-D-galactose acyltransferase
MRVEKWDTGFWGATIARTDYVTDLSHATGVDCAWSLFNAGDFDSIHEAEERGAQFMDFRVMYARETGPEVGIARAINPDDVDALAAISRTAFRGLTRFYADPNFPDDRCDDLYEGWFRENVADPLVAVLMVGDGRGPAGFVTIRLSAEEASIVLIAVDEGARGRGIGENLTRAAVNHVYHAGIPRITVVTQGGNIPSQRAFQAAGFRVESSSVWLHKWYVEPDEVHPVYGTCGCGAAMDEHGCPHGH